MEITHVIANIDALNGQVIRVSGYLGTCFGYDCVLFRNQNEKAQWDRVMAQLAVRARDYRAPVPVIPDLPMLGIGSGENFEFDRAAAHYNNSYVVITGRVTNVCRYHGVQACTDRSTDLEPTQIARWSPQGAQAGTPAQ